MQEKCQADVENIQELPKMKTIATEIKNSMGLPENYSTLNACSLLLLHTVNSLKGLKKFKEDILRRIKRI